MAEILYKYRSLKNFKRFTDILFNKRLYSLVEFLGANIQYPAECEKAKIEGRVLVEFVVENDGSITSLVVKQSVHPLLDQEALRVVGQMPRWFPATTDKGTVRVKYTVPISFKL